MTTQPMTAIGQAVLIRREGKKLKSYRDSVNVWTIGVGHTAAAGPPIPGPGVSITDAEADALFQKDHLVYAGYVDQMLNGIKLADHQRDALISFCYNVGPKWFIGKKPGAFVRLIREGKLDQVPDALLRYNKPSEIIPRRQAEADQFATPYSVRLPSQTRGGKPIKAPKPQAVAPMAPKVVDVTTPFRPTYISGLLGDLWLKLTGKTPNVTVAYTKPPGFKGDDTVFDIQSTLRAKGFTEVGTLDGIVGTDTRQALRNAMRNNGDDPDKSAAFAKFNNATLNYVNKIAPKVGDPLREAASFKQVKNDAPEITRPINTLTGVGVSMTGLGGIGAAIQYAKETLDSVKGTADAANSVIVDAAPAIEKLSVGVNFVSQYPWIIFGGIGFMTLIMVGSTASTAVMMYRLKRIN